MRFSVERRSTLPWHAVQRGPALVSTPQPRQTRMTLTGMRPARGMRNRAGRSLPEARALRAWRTRRTGSHPARASRSGPVASLRPARLRHEEPVRRVGGRQLGAQLLPERVAQLGDGGSIALLGLGRHSPASRAAMNRATRRSVGRIEPSMRLTRWRGTPIRRASSVWVKPRRTLSTLRSSPVVLSA
jgi:hypothetical protein